MKHAFMAALILSAFASATRAEMPGQPKAPKPSHVTETLYGQTVTDPYQFIRKLGSETTHWMKAEGRYTRSFCASMPGRDALGRAQSHG